jgi:hypothetical protein
MIALLYCNSRSRGGRGQSRGGGVSQSVVKVLGAQTQ